MAIVFDEIEATVMPEAAAESGSGDPGQGGADAPADAHTLQRELARMRERALRLRAD